MLTITDINNNANSVRVINHSSNYTKYDLLNAAERVKTAKHSFINRRGARLMLSHSIAGDAARIKHKKPAKKDYHVFIDEYIDTCGDGYTWNIDENEIFNDIIVSGNNREFSPRIEQSNYCELFSAIVQRSDELRDELNNYAAHDKYTCEIYENMCDIINDFYGVSVTPHAAGAIRKTLNKPTSNYYISYYSDNERAAELLTILTPYKWNCETIRGAAQRDWNIIFYPSELYSDENIRYFESFYFGMYTSVNARYKNDAINFDYPYYIDREQIIIDVCNNYGVTPENVRANWYY